MQKDSKADDANASPECKIPQSSCWDYCKIDIFARGAGSPGSGFSVSPQNDTGTPEMIHTWEDDCMPNTAMDPIWNLFFDQNSVEYLPNAESQSDKNRKFFSYPYQKKSEMDIKYFHDGERSWSAPTDPDCNLVFLVSRNNDDTYGIWKLCGQEQIKKATSDAGKISAGGLQSAGLKSNEPTYLAADLQKAQDWIHKEAE